MKKVDDFWEKVKQIEQERQGLADLPARIEELQLNNIGKVLAVKTRHGNYAVIEVSDYSEGIEEGTGGHTTTYTLNYKYNPSGEAVF